MQCMIAPTSLEDLPTDLLRMISARLDWRTRARFSMTSGTLWRLLRDGLPPESYPCLPGWRELLEDTRRMPEPFLARLDAILEGLRTQMKATSWHVRTLYLFQRHRHFQESGLRTGDSATLCSMYTAALTISSPYAVSIELEHTETKRRRTFEFPHHMLVPLELHVEHMRTPFTPSEVLQNLFQELSKHAIELLHIWQGVQIDAIALARRWRAHCVRCFDATTRLHVLFRGVLWASSLERLLIHEDHLQNPLTNTLFMVTRPNPQSPEHDDGWMYVDNTGEEQARLYVLQNPSAEDLRRCFALLLDPALGIVTVGRKPIETLRTSHLSSTAPNTSEEADLSSYVDEMQNLLYREFPSGFVWPHLQATAHSLDWSSL